MRYLIIILFLILAWCLVNTENTRESFTDNMLSNIKQTHRKYRRNIRKNIDKTYQDALSKIKRTMRKNKLV